MVTKRKVEVTSKLLMLATVPIPASGQTGMLMYNEHRAEIWLVQSDTVFKRQEWTETEERRKCQRKCQQGHDGLGRVRALEQWLVLGNKYTQSRQDQRLRGKVYSLLGHGRSHGNRKARKGVGWRICQE